MGDCLQQLAVASVRSGVCKFLVSSTRQRAEGTAGLPGAVGWMPAAILWENREASELALQDAADPGIVGVHVDAAGLRLSNH